MDIDENVPEHWKHLGCILPEDLREQLADLILSRLGSGHGEIRIEIHDHAIRRIVDGEYILPKEQQKVKKDA